MVWATHTTSKYFVRRLALPSRSSLTTSARHIVLRDSGADPIPSPPQGQLTGTTKSARSRAPAIQAWEESVSAWGKLCFRSRQRRFVHARQPDLRGQCSASRFAGCNPNRFGLTSLTPRGAKRYPTQNRAYRVNRNEFQIKRWFSKKREPRRDPFVSIVPIL
jgi:hypothetical protein